MILVCNIRRNVFNVSRYQKVLRGELIFHKSHKIANHTFPSKKLTSIRGLFHFLTARVDKMTKEVTLKALKKIVYIVLLWRVDCPCGVR